MELISMMLLIWAIHAGIATVLSAPVVFFGRKRVYWRLGELVVLILPFTVWSVLMCSELAVGRKSLANCVEPFYFAAAVPLAALIRVTVGSRIPEKLSAGILIAAICALAAGVFFMVPSLPE